MFLNYWRNIRANSLATFSGLILISTALFAEDVPIDSDMNFRIISNSSPSSKTESNSTADHSKFESLKGPFNNGSEVTKACLSCHTEAGQHFMKSIHWTWEYKHPNTGQILGKKTLINTFCTNSKVIGSKLIMI